MAPAGLAAAAQAEQRAGGGVALEAQAARAGVAPQAAAVVDGRPELCLALLLGVLGLRVPRGVIVIWGDGEGDGRGGGGIFDVFPGGADCGAVVCGVLDLFISNRWEVSGGDIRMLPAPPRPYIM